MVNESHEFKNYKVMTIKRIFGIWIFIIGISISVSSCKKMQEKATVSEEKSEVVYNKVEQLQWLLGNWENISEEKSVLRKLDT